MKSKTNPPRSSTKVFLALGFVWAGLSLLFLFLGLRTIRAERQFQTESIAAPGTISSKRVHERNGIDPSTKRPSVSRTYYLKATFADERGQDREIETSVSAERWDSARENDPVEVRYLPANAKSSRITGDSQLGKAYVFSGLGVFGVLMGLMVGVSGLRNRNGLPPGKDADRP